jgi:hypothetical protein
VIDLKTLTLEQSQRVTKLEQDLVVGNQAFEHFLGDLTQHFSAKPEMTGRMDTLRQTQGIMEDLRELRSLVSFRQRCVVEVELGEGGYFGLLLAGWTLRNSLSHL